MSKRWARRGATGLALAVCLVAQPPARALPFEPGEELKLEVHFLGLTAGELTLSVGYAEANGVESWPLELQAKTRGLVGAMYSLQETLVSQFDPKTDSSSGYDLSSVLNGDPHQEHVRYEGKAAHVHVVRRSGTRDETKPILAGAMDALAAVYRLRSVPLDGSGFVVPIFTGKKSWNLEGRVIGRARVQTDAGTFDTVVVRCRTHFDGKFSSDRGLTVWLSSDARRLPVKLEADFMIGSMKGTLVQYRSGVVAQNDPPAR